MIACAASLANAAAAHAVDDLLIGHFNGHHSVETNTCPFHGFSLSNRAGHAVEDITIGAIGLLQSLIDDADDHFIGYQFAGVHILLGLQAGGRTVFHSGTQDVAGGNGGDGQLFLENLCLGAFACTRST